MWLIVDTNRVSGLGERRGGISVPAISPTKKMISCQRKAETVRSSITVGARFFARWQCPAPRPWRWSSGGRRTLPAQWSALNLTSTWRALPLFCGASLDPFFPKGFSLRFRGRGEFGSRSRRSIDGGGAARPPVFGTWFHGGTAQAVLSSSLLAHSLALCISLTLSTSPLRRSLSHNPRSLVRSDTNAILNALHLARTVIPNCD